MANERYKNFKEKFCGEQRMSITKLNKVELKKYAMKVDFLIVPFQKRQSVSLKREKCGCGAVQFFFTVMCVSLLER